MLSSAAWAADGIVLESLEWDGDATPRWRGVSLPHIPNISSRSILPVPAPSDITTSRTLTTPLVAGASYIVELDLAIQNNTAPLRVSLYAVAAMPANSECLLASSRIVRGSFGDATYNEPTIARILVTIPEDVPQPPSRRVFTMPFQNASANANSQRLRVMVEDADTNAAVHLVRVRLCEPPSVPVMTATGQRSYTAFLSDATELVQQTAATPPDKLPPWLLRLRAGGYDTAVIPVDGVSGASGQIVQLLYREGIAYLPMIDLSASFSAIEDMLAPEAQEAVLVRVEQVAIQTRHQSLCAGVAVRLPASRYAQYADPDETCGVDPAVLRAFYSRMADRIAAHHPNARLYLFGDAMLSSESSRQYFTPTLPRRSTVQAAVRRIGWDARQPLDCRVVMPRTTFVAPLASLDASSLGRELDSDPTNETTFSESVAALFVYASHQHKEQEEEVIVVGDAATARWAHHLAVADVHHIFEGGDTLPPLIADNAAAFIREFRRIPNVPFQRLATPTPQPLTVRTASVDGATWVYCVNASSVPIIADIALSLPAGKMPNVEGRLTPTPVPPATHSWQLSLPPYALRVACLGPSVVVHQATVEKAERASDTVALTVLKDRVALLTSLVREAKRGVRYDVATAEPFSLPATGRLFVLAQVGGLATQDTANQGAVPIRFILFGRDASGTEFQKAVDVVPQPGTEQVIDGIRWGRVVVPFLAIPSGGTARLAIEPPRIGQLWVDDLTIYSVAFTASEVHELTRRVSVASQRLDDGKWTSLELSLDGYWMAYLTEHVPLKTALPIIATPAASPSSASSTAQTLWGRARNWMPW